MSGPQVKWELVGDASKSHAAIDSVGKKVDGLNSKFSSIGKGIQLGLGLGAFSALQSAVSTVVGKFGEMDQMYKDDAASAAILTNAMKTAIPGWNGNTDAMNKYMESNAKFGATMNQQRDGMVKFIGLTHDQAKAQDMMSAAIALAAARHIPLEDAITMTTMAYEGKTRALQKLGVVIDKHVTGMAAVTEITKQAGDAAEVYAGTSAGKQAAAQVKITEAMVKMGGVIDKVSSVVLPALADAFSFLVDNIFPVIGAAIDWITKNVMPGLIKVFQVVGTVAGAVFRGIVTAIQVATSIIKIIVGIWSVEFAILGSVFRGIATVVSTVFSSVGSIIKGAINGVIGIINGMISAIDAIQVHIHVGPVNLDWNGLRIPKLHYLHSGGIVPGVPGTDVLTVLQAGERVSPAGSPAAGGGTVVHIHIEGPVYADGPAIDMLANKIAQRLRYAPGV